MDAGRYRVIGHALAALLAAAPLSAQPVEQLKTMSASGSIGANGESVIMPGTAGMASLLIQTTGTFSLTWELQCSGDGSTYDADDEVPVTLISSTPTPADSVTGAVQGLYTATIAGCRSIRVIATAFTSGSLTVTMTAISTGGSSGGGGGGAASSVSITQGGNTAAVNASSQLSVNCANCSGSGASDIEGSTFTLGTDSVAPMGAYVDETSPTAATEDRMSTPRLTLQRALHVNLRNASGTELTPTVDVTEDVAETAGGTGPMVMSVRRDTAASSSGASGDNSTFNTDSAGLLWARLGDPCSSAATKQYLPINIVTATTTEITPSLAGASTHYYVCSINIGPVAGAQNIALVDDDSDGCGSPTSGLAGGTTAGTGWNIAANGGLTMGNGLGSIARTNGTNRVLCLVTSAAVQTSGVITVAAAP